jgi:hypothetical protein
MYTSYSHLTLNSQEISLHIVRPPGCAVPQRLSQIWKIHLLFHPLVEQTLHDYIPAENAVKSKGPVS